MSRAFGVLVPCSRALWQGSKRTWSRKPSTLSFRQSFRALPHSCCGWCCPAALHPADGSIAIAPGAKAPRSKTADLGFDARVAWHALWFLRVRPPPSPTTTTHPLCEKSRFLTRLEDEDPPSPRTSPPPPEMSVPSHLLQCAQRSSKIQKHAFCLATAAPGLHAFAAWTCLARLGFFLLLLPLLIPINPNPDSF